MVLWIKSLHVIAVIAWMAALLYLPRLMVYHADTPPGSNRSELFKVMEWRLLRAIATPAMIATFVFGLWTMWELEAWREGWFHAKLFLVLLLAAYHGFCVVWLKALKADDRRRGPRFFRMVNEIPALLMVAVVILVIVKPF